MLALTRALGNRDLPRLSATDDATFFPLLGRLVTYPQALAWPLAGLAVLAVTACAVAARRRRLTTVPRLLTGTAAALIPLIAAPAAAAGLWALLVAVRPGYAALSLGDPYRPTLYRSQDTVTQLVAAIRRVRRLHPAAAALELAGNDYHQPGKPACAWDDQTARQQLVDELVRDALVVLEELEGAELDGEQAEAVGLLGWSPVKTSNRARAGDVADRPPGRSRPGHQRGRLRQPAPAQVAGQLPRRLQGPSGRRT